MKLLSEVSAVGLVAWLADFYLLATLLMLVALAARRRIRQPAQRLTVNWVVAVELAALAAVCALPFWPRIPLLRPILRNPRSKRRWPPTRRQWHCRERHCRGCPEMAPSFDVPPHSRRYRIGRAADFSPAPLVLHRTGRRRVPCLRRADNRVARSRARWRR